MQQLTKIKRLYFAIILCLTANPLFGQDLLYPAEQFYKFGAEFTESIETFRLEILMTDRARYEPIRDYSKSDPLRTNAILDRLLHNAHRIQLKGESM